MAQDEHSGWVVGEPRRLPWYVWVVVVIPLIAVGIGLAVTLAAVVFFGLIYGW